MSLEVTRRGRVTKFKSNTYNKPLRMMNKPISTFIINLKKRTDRKKYAIKEFSTRPEFAINIVEAIESAGGALGLWKTIQMIVSKARLSNDDYIIICEDDHKFTKNYNKEYLENSIAIAHSKDADVLFGGVSWFSNSIKIDDQLFWVENFSGTQFFVVFRKFFDTIHAAVLDDENPADYKIGNLTNNKILMYPFISVQKEFGYSDTTWRNNEEGRVSGLFKAAQGWMKLLENVSGYYKSAEIPEDIVEADIFETTTLPTYVINLPERTERLVHIKEQFEGRNEFDVTFVRAYKHKVGAFGLWKTIRKIVKMAIERDEDVIVICEDDHIFTEQYSKEYLIRNIIEAHAHGAKYLSGGTGQFGYAVPITENRYWVSHCLSAQFLVIYKRFFKEILARPYDKSVIADMLYSEMTSSKMVLYPFISLQKDFGYSDVTELHNKDKTIVSRLFAQSNKRLNNIQSAYRKYHGS
ncbi:hypothetical protein [Pedobacter sp. B4-66]|uniref:hypothetical protein n=1 Tax=Pedobacter sp. B4-66 TaxID=2817280 RepID=UPI002025832E|nr:hypothetical protein [Pedobacter sp. B4-66]